ncbi:hypothetical protein J3R30DRAFT_128696 [Lentinula aciculospora]|uniref:Uncharacterized protein n=1 Tax=Lentinula aciculospora TaxID=153920 RepID=A0A9W9AUB7_9AGAR|nr:hypothetical protein J3R30DRAFT_128696 [Lentinula aciculospora]
MYIISMMCLAHVMVYVVAFIFGVCSVAYAAPLSMVNSAMTSRSNHDSNAGLLLAPRLDGSAGLSPRPIDERASQVLPQYLYVSFKGISLLKVNEKDENAAQDIVEGYLYTVYPNRKVTFITQFTTYADDRHDSVRFGVTDLSRPLPFLNGSQHSHYSGVAQRTPLLQKDHNYGYTYRGRLAAGEDVWVTLE